MTYYSYNYSGTLGAGLENSDVRFRRSLHQSKPVRYLFTLTGWAGKAFVHKVQKVFIA